MIRLQLEPFTTALFILECLLPTVTLTLALVTAKLTSLVRDTLMQKIPESLKNWRRIIWHSVAGVTELHTVCTGLAQSASETTVHTSFGKLRDPNTFYCGHLAKMVSNKLETRAQGTAIIFLHYV